MTGISYNTRQRKWRASYKKCYIGSFDTEGEAVAARKDYMATSIRALKRIPNKPNFSLTASSSIFTMKNYPTNRRVRTIEGTT